MPGEVFSYSKDGYTLTIMGLSNNSNDIGDIAEVTFSKSFI